ncbi:MAG: nucleotidyltransferase domain-containing protein [Calditrichaeota bacterium]|nr:nucleotidyltransferase domain-containing protein [Calditrichota bacterium]
MITLQLLNKIVRIIVKKYNPEKIILFGSYAQGKQDEESDLDLLIIKHSDIPRYKRALPIRKHLRGMKIPIDILVYTQQEIEKWKSVNTAFITQIIEQGRILYERQK